MLLQSYFFFQNGLYSALPYIGFWGIINISGVLADLAQKCLSATFTRKLFDISGTSIFTGNKNKQFPWQVNIGENPTAVYDLAAVK